MTVESVRQEQGHDAPVLTFTDAARERVQGFLAAQNRPGLALRVAITGKTSGGFRYAMGLVEEVSRDAGDVVVGGVDQRDRGAVAVADEDRLGRVELREHLRQHVERLGVEERDGARLGRRLRAAVAEAREGEHAPARRLLQRLGEPAPQADRPEPLVQQDERAPIGVAGELEGLEAAVGDADAAHAAGVMTAASSGSVYSRAT